MTERKKNKKISISIKKSAKKQGKKIFSDIAKRIDKPIRTIATINIWRLEQLAKKYPGKTFVVPGIVLGEGELSQSIFVAALKFSKTAKEKIIVAKGKAMSLDEFANTSQKESEMVIVK